MNRLARTAENVDSAKRRLSDGQYLKKDNQNRNTNENSKNNNNNSENSKGRRSKDATDDESDEYPTVDFVNISYGYKRRITLNPFSTVQHIRKFLDDRIKLDYLDDFSLAVAQQQFRDNLQSQDHNNLDPFSGNRSRRNRRTHRKSTSSEISRAASPINPKLDDLPKSIEELPRVSYEEALESIKLQQTVKVDKRWLGLKKEELKKEEENDENNEENNEYDEILGFLTTEGECIQAFSYEHINFLNVYSQANTLKFMEAGGKLTRENNNFYLAILRVDQGEINAITPLFLHPTRLVELLPACRDWLRQYTVALKRKKDAMARMKSMDEKRKSKK